jgi:polysaccharide export outer membrane protein
MEKILLAITLILMVTLSLTHVAYSEEENLTSKEETATETDDHYYKIGKGDILEIIAWKEEDFTREVFVRMDGKISFPLLDDIQAAGRTTMQVKNEIETKLKEFVEDPIVTVILKSPMSQKFYILGEVLNTGEYQLVKKLTILQAFALAGGFTEWASKNEIILLRNENGIDKLIRVNYKNIIKGKDLSQNVSIKVNDTIIVP